MMRKRIYEGDFFKNKIEGNGKYIYKSGYYYIGQFKNGERNGKGIQYYPNGNIRYEGDFVDDLYDGNGKVFFEGGQYYVGQFKG